VDVKGDRRAWKIQLTKAGRAYFNEMAMAHESWILESFEGLQRKDIQSLYKLLALVKASALNKLEKIDTLQESDTEHLTEHL
jgi:DNA-binding MarR family transcriptional regulator